jgi:formamidopyrimidine-DNA glycosylase
VPEGDTIHRAARSINTALAGKRIELADAPSRRSPLHLRAGELQDQTMVEAEAHGKHLLVHFSGGAVVHSHLGMNGRWRIVAGIGNVIRNEACFATGVSPRRAVRDLTPEEAARLLGECERIMGVSVREGRRARDLPRQPPRLSGLRWPDRGARAGRRQPHRLLVPFVSEMSGQR